MPFLLFLYPLLMTPLSLCFAFCSLWLMKPELLRIIFYGKSEPRWTALRAHAGHGSVLVCSVSPVSHSHVPRLLLELGLCSERSVTVRLLPHGMLGLTFPSQVSKQSPTRVFWELPQNHYWAHTLNSGRNSVKTQSPVSKPSAFLLWLGH